MTVTSREAFGSSLMMVAGEDAAPGVSGGAAKVSPPVVSGDDTAVLGFW